MSKQISDDCKNAFIHSFILLQHCQNIEDARETVTLIMTVFGKCHMSKDVQKATKKLHSKIKHWKVADKPYINQNVDCNQMNPGPDNSQIMKRYIKSIRKSSPWLTYFKTNY